MYLQEAFYTSVKLNSRKNTIAEILVNPTNSEMSKLLRDSGYPDLKFIADGLKKKLYVFSVDLLHTEAAKIIGIPITKGFYLAGFIQKYKGRWEVNISRNQRNKTKLRELNWSWTEKYVLGVNDILK
jgi:hypothetical protein